MKASYCGKTYQFDSFDETWRFYRQILNALKQVNNPKVIHEESRASDPVHL
ncbi:hypothetical protein GCM10009111_25240 [Colwellia asteriadis]|uniref:Uncharacterized protein n=1 Tax=Colwellia asteriadis TaxID=517723 RepID=A0ABN1L8V7_9GAMM